MYLEEEMQEQTMTGTAARWINHLSTRLDYILTEQQQMAGRLAALESPIQAFEDQPALVEAMREQRDRIAEQLTQMREDYAALANEKADLQQENKRLRSLLAMMQDGYNVISRIQAEIDANEREMGGHRCCTG